jgi:hypothetical protein
MSEKLLNQFIDSLKKKYSRYNIYIENQEGFEEGVLIMNDYKETYEFDIKTLHIYTNTDYNIINDVHQSFIQFRRQHLLNQLI